jgi:hypothetical protein
MERCSVSLGALDHRLRLRNVVSKACSQSVQSQCIVRLLGIYPTECPLWVRSGRRRPASHASGLPLEADYPSYALALRSAGPSPRLAAALCGPQRRSFELAIAHEANQCFASDPLGAKQPDEVISAGDAMPSSDRSMSPSCRPANAAEPPIPLRRCARPAGLPRAPAPGVGAAARSAPRSRCARGVRVRGR